MTLSAMSEWPFSTKVPEGPVKSLRDVSSVSIQLPSADVEPTHPLDPTEDLTGKRRQLQRETVSKEVRNS